MLSNLKISIAKDLLIIFVSGKLSILLDSIVMISLHVIFLYIRLPFHCPLNPDVLKHILLPPDGVLLKLRFNYLDFKALVVARIY